MLNREELPNFGKTSSFHQKELHGLNISLIFSYEAQVLFEKSCLSNARNGCAAVDKQKRFSIPMHWQIHFYQKL